jgi:hypothetical protein
MIMMLPFSLLRPLESDRPKKKSASKPKPKPKKKPVPKKKPAPKKKPSTKKRKAPKKQSAPKKKFMYRVVVSAQYSRRTGKSRNSYKSAAFMVRGFFRSESDAVMNIQGMKDLAKAGRLKTVKKQGKAWISVKERKPNVEMPIQMELDPEKLGITTEDEK